MTDSEIRNKLIGTWVCKNKATPHTITYKSNGKIEIVMTPNNVFNPAQAMGIFVKLFSGDTCEGNYNITNSVVTLNLETVPKSWMNLRVLGMNLSFGDILTRVYGTFYNATNQSKLRVSSISSSKMELTPWWNGSNSKASILFEKS